jgi:hypothetical protein
MGAKNIFHNSTNYLLGLGGGITIVAVVAKFYHDFPYAISRKGLPVLTAFVLLFGACIIYVVLSRISNLVSRLLLLTVGIAAWWLLFWVSVFVHSMETGHF